MAVLQPEQLGMNRRAALEPVMAKILGDGVGRREADDLVARRLMGLPDRAKRKALAGPGPAIDDLQPARAGRMLERRASRAVNPLAMMVRARSSFSAVTTGLRPPFRPRVAAATSPARLRSCIRLRSNWPKAP